MQCPDNAFRYNTTQCACNPGYLYTASARSCQLFSDGENVELRSGVDYSIALPETIFNFDSIKKFTQSQAVFLEATLVMLISWLFFCLIVRIVGPLRDGRSRWFKIRWWISRLDVCFATRHWLEDQKVVMKRKTELGGTFSIASWILFIGLFAALLYQIISKRSVEVHNIRATNLPDLTSFKNDLVFSITTISSMSCSHLRGLGAYVVGNPGFIDYRVSPFSTFANYSCVNTTKGPTITLKCNNCSLLRDTAYVSWQFVDLPNDPATAVGFYFNLTANSPGNKKHLSSVNGTLKSIHSNDRTQVTFRGTQPNILKFNLFPKLYHNMHDLKLIQPLLHDFLPGSYFSDVSQLQASLLDPNDGLVNTTLFVNFLSAYILEIDNQSILGPVSFLADLGGLYCFSIGIFFYLLVQFEYRIKKLRHEGNVMRNIRRRQKAQGHWDKLRKYVMYTWGPSTLDGNYNNARNDSCCIPVDSFHKSRSSVKRRKNFEPDTISFSTKTSLPTEQKAVPASTCALVLSHGSTEPVCELGERSTSSNELEHIAAESTKGGNHGREISSEPKIYSQTKGFLVADDLTPPPPPLLETAGADEIRITDLQKDIQNLYNYNVMLREKLVNAQSMLHVLSEKRSS